MTDQGGSSYTKTTNKSRSILQDHFLTSKKYDLIGIENSKAEIHELLDLEGKDAGLCSIISIVGIGSIGKTTLARNVYEDIKVKKKFYVCAWVNVTKSYSMKKVVKDMLQQFYQSTMQPVPVGIEEKDEMSIIDEIRKFLGDKRYMVVFDDVWDSNLWDYLKNAFPDNNLSNKILLTTQQQTLTLAWQQSWTNNHIYELKSLSHEQSFELFCNKAFQGGQCPQFLQQISQQIVHKCEGIPLSLIILGGLLSTKNKDFTEWKMFYDNLCIELQQNPQLSNISKILLLSFNDLPDFLQPCLLYFAMFPKSSSVEYNRLIELWTAEDFVQENHNIEIEDIAKEYLVELIQRNLVQVSTWYDSGRARKFCVHDLVHDILRGKSRELNFCQILDTENIEVNTQSKRLSIQEGNNLDGVLRGIDEDSKPICSVLLFKAQYGSNVLSSSSILKRVSLLKVLDLQNAPLDQIPEEIRDLFHLQYLNLRYTKVKCLPKSIGRLENLLTLDCKRCPISELPFEISNLRKLRNLIVYQNSWHDTLKVWVIGAVKIPQNALEHLGNLQKLADVNVASSVGFIDHLSKFRKLKYLAVSDIKSENSFTLCKAIEQLNCLESLNITADYDSDEPIDLQHMNTPLLNLERLYLTGPLNKFPEWIGKLEKLNKLRFKGSKLNDIPFDKLQDLPSLTMLGINKDVYYGEQIVFQAGGFGKLKAMYFDSLQNLKSIEIQSGGLPVLEDLLIHRCPQLKEVPVGLQYLGSLKSLKLVEMSKEFVDGITSLPHFVSHVVDIQVGYQAPSGQYIYKKL